MSLRQSLNRALTISELYGSVSNDDERCDVSQCITAWKTRHTTLRESDFEDMLKLRGYSPERYAQCLNRNRKISNDSMLQWQRDVLSIWEYNTHCEPFSDVSSADLISAFAPFMAYAADELLADISKASYVADRHAILAALLSALGKRLLSAGVKTLILEMNRERILGHLSGESGQERKHDYCVKLCDPAYREALFGEYPVLARFSAQTVIDFVRFCGRFLHHVELNRRSLSERFGLGEDFIVDDLILDSGDLHDHGSSVIIMTVGESRIVYKPRNLSTHVLFGRLARRCERTEAFLPMNVSQVLECGEYGFEEFVETRDCAVPEEVCRYYRRYGQLMGLIWLLHGNDMHYENIVPSGEYPQIVDFETVVTNKPKFAGRKDDAAGTVQKIIEHSLEYSALLPSQVPINAQGKTIDVSALDPSQQTMPALCPQIMSLDSDDAHYEYHAMKLDKSSHVLTLGGKPVDPYRYRDEISRGFDAAIGALSDIGVEELRGIVKDDITIRILVRPTNSYARFLDFMHHPSVLHDMRDVEAILENLYVFPFINKDIYLSEYDQLLSGNIPIFRSSTSSRSLTDPDGRIIGNACEQTPKKIILSKRMRIRQLAVLQSRIIRNALGMCSTRTPIPTPSDWNDRDYAYAVAEEIMKESVTDDRSGTVAWISSKRTDFDGAFNLSVNSNELYLGQTGTALLFLELARQARDSRYSLFGNVCMESAFRFEAASPTQSAFSGGLSRSYGALRFLGEARNARLSRELSTMIRTLPEYARKYLTDDGTLPFSTHLDYVTGASGMEMLMLVAHRALGDDSILDQVQKMAFRIIGETHSRWNGIGADDFLTFPSGAAHGMEGMAVVFWRLYTVFGDPEFIRFARELWHRAGLRRQTQKEHSITKWCRGDIGVLWAQNELDSETSPEGERFFNGGTRRVFSSKGEIGTMLDKAVWADDTVCHGRCGAIDTLISCYNATDDEWYLDHARHLMNGMLGEACERGGFRLGHVPEFVDLSYFLGPVGVAYTMLRVQDPTVPSILSLEMRQ